MALFNIPGTLPSVGDLKSSIPIGVSPLGTPVFDDITFPAGNYTDLNGEIIEYSEFKIQSARVIVNRAKNIVKTPIAGREGEIKEFVSFGDYMINVEGKLSELLDVFPHDQMKLFKGLENAIDNVAIISKLLNDVFSVFNVVIERFTTRTIPGSINEVDVSIEMLSDIDLDLNDFLLQNK